MATYYIWSGATGAGTGADWANAFTTINAGTASKVGLDKFYVAHDHNENGAAAIIVDGAGSQDQAYQITCVDRAGSVPPVAADVRNTAQVNTNGAFNITFKFHQIVDGIIFRAGSAANTASIRIDCTNGNFRNCQFILNNTSTTSLLGSNVNNGCIQFDDCSVEFGSTSQRLNTVIGTKWIWRNSSGVAAITGATTGAFLINANNPTTWWFEGLDLSAYTAKTLAQVSNNANLTFKNCKFGATTVPGTVGSGEGSVVKAINCDSGDTNWLNQLTMTRGTLTTLSTIYRNGGASDGTTPICWRMTTAASATQWPGTIEYTPISFWNEVVGTPITITIELGSPTASLTNKNVWMDVAAMTVSGFPIGPKVTSGAANVLTVATALTTSSAIWTGTVANKYKISVTITPQEKGLIYIYLKSTNTSGVILYIDPKPVIS
jgi:hypothetical protein